MASKVTAKAGTAADAEVIRGGQSQTSTGPTIQVQPALNPEAGAGPTAGVAVEGTGLDTNGNAVAEGQAQAGEAGSQTEAGPGLRSPQSLFSSGPSSSTDAGASSGSGQPMAVSVTTVIHKLEGVPEDAETAMQKLRADFHSAHMMINNVGHYAALPFEEIAKLMASMATMMSVIRSKL